MCFIIYIYGLKVFLLAFVQVFNLLKPLSGLFIFDGFNTCINCPNPDELAKILQVKCLSLNVIISDCRMETNIYMIQRSILDTCILPIKYDIMHINNNILNDNTKIVTYSLLNNINYMVNDTILDEIKLSEGYIYFRQNNELHISKGFVQFRNDIQLFELISNL